MLQSRLPMVSLLSLLTLSCMLDITLILVIFLESEMGFQIYFLFTLRPCYPWESNLPCNLYLPFYCMAIFSNYHLSLSVTFLNYGIILFLHRTIMV